MSCGKPLDPCPVVDEIAEFDGEGLPCDVPHLVREIAELDESTLDRGLEGDHIWAVPEAVEAGFRAGARGLFASHRGSYPDVVN